MACAAVALVLTGRELSAQENYEIQVYGSETVAPRTTMVELHSNFTANGSREVAGTAYTSDGTFPTDHAEHQTVEITQGLNRWSEVGFYVFTTYRVEQGYEWVGDHLRPRVRAPEEWRWPVGVSLSTELGYQRARFSTDTWTWEIRPIVDKQMGRLYASFNPALDRAWHGPGVSDGVVFSPNVKVGYDFTRKLQAGFEYYGATGPIFSPSSLHDQQHQLFAVADLNVSPRWEINFGVGVGMTRSTDHWIAKGIVGRRFNWPGAPKPETPKSIETH